MIDYNFKIFSKIKKSFFIFLLFLFFLPTDSSALRAVEVRLKDIARIDGIRENQLTGFGIVVGLPGTGDSKNAITSESMKNYLKNLGLSTNLNASQTRNIASVLITADLSSFAKSGDRIDVTVSSIGDAKSLEGGVLLQSPLKSAKNEVMAVASGVISFGGREERGSASQSPGKEYRFGSGVGEKKDSGQVSNPKNQQKNVGIIHKGGIVEKEITGNFFNSPKFRVILGDQDFSTLNAISKIIDEKFSIKSVAISPIEIEVSVPEKSTAVAFLAELENLKVEPDNRAKVVINERTGTIVMGANVTVDEVAISRQGLSLIVAGRNKESMNTSEQKVLMIEEATRVSDIVDALNKVGASTKDIIAILESLKKAGALHARGACPVKIEDYTNRLNLTDRPEVNVIRNFSEKISEKNRNSSKSFEDIMNEEINEKLNGKVSSSSVKRPHRIKDEIQADSYRKKLYDASVEFESIFVKMMLNQMKKSVEKTGLIHGGYAEDIFEDMLYDEYAKNISRTSSVGIAEEIYLSLSKSLPPVKLDQKI